MWSYEIFYLVNHIPMLKINTNFPESDLNTYYESSQKLCVIYPHNLNPRLLHKYSKILKMFIHRDE
jgi:hypothetical protein